MTKIEFITKYGIDKYNKRLEQIKQWRKDNPNYRIEYYNSHKKEETEQQKIYNKTQKGRANMLLQGYKKMDIQADRGECTLTTEWIIDNIFNSKCIYCGESDWKKLGCDRIDNSLPHTVDNVQCCCGKCNVKKHLYTNEEFIEKNNVQVD